MLDGLLYDYIVSVLYTLKRKNQTGYFSLKEIVENLDYPASPNEIFDIGKYLEAEGLVKANFRLGDVFVEITPQGIVYIEDKDDNFLPSFEQYLDKKNKQAHIQKIASRLTNKSMNESKKPILEKINNIIAYLNNTAPLKNSDLHKDAKILKLEIEKENPDKEVLSIKLMNIEQFSGLQRKARELSVYLNYYTPR